MSLVRSYRDLTVWTAAVELCVEVYRATEAFPKTEMYGLCQQLRRAAVSVASNIAEGHQRNTTTDYIRFCHLALGSTGEIDTQLEISFRLKYLTPEGYAALNVQLVEIRKMLMAMIKSLEARRDLDGKVREPDIPYGAVPDRP